MNSFPIKSKKIFINNSISHVLNSSVLLLIGIILLGFILRFHQYTEWPRNGATFDEYAWTFLGMSLLNTGVPTSWSPHQQYDVRTHFVNTQGASFFLVTPYLEHPPLFGIIAGLNAELSGIEEFNDVHPGRIRKLALVLGVVSIIALYLLVKETVNEKVALLAAFLYAIVPSVVIGSRLIQNENFFIPFFLLSLFLAVKYIHTKKGLYATLSIIIAALLPLAKVPWVVAPLTVTAIFFMEKKYKYAGLSVLVSFVFFSFFLLYGYLLNWNLFINLWTLQLARYDIGYDTLFAFFRDPVITDRLFIDGLIYVGFLAFALVASLKERRFLPVLLGFLSYLFIFLFAIPNELGHGWYRYPLYPFFIAMCAIVIWKFFNKDMIITWLFLLIPGLAAMTNAWQKLFGFSYGSYRLFLLFSSLGLLTLVFPHVYVKKFTRFTNIITACFVIVLIIISSWLYTEQ